MNEPLIFGELQGEEGGVEFEREAGGFRIRIDHLFSDGAQSYQITDAQMAELILWAKERIVEGVVEGDGRPGWTEIHVATVDNRKKPT